MYVYLKNGERRELPQAQQASERDGDLVLLDHGQREVGRVRIATIAAYSRWPIAAAHAARGSVRGIAPANPARMPPPAGPRAAGV